MDTFVFFNIFFIFHKLVGSKKKKNNFSKKIQIMIEAAAFNSKLPSDLRLAAAASATRRLVTPPTSLPSLFFFQFFFNF